MSVGSQIGSAEETVDLVAIVAILAVVGYALYKLPGIWASLKTDLGTSFSAMLAPFNAASKSITDAGTSASTSIDTQLNQYEANTPSELAITVFSGPSDTIALPPTTPGLPPGYNPATGTIDETLVYNGGTGK